MTTKQKWGWAIAILVVIAIWYFWADISKLWSNDGADERTKVVYDKMRCCTPSNPCGWSGATFKNVCG